MSSHLWILLVLGLGSGQTPERREVLPSRAPSEPTYSVEVEFEIETGPQRARVPAALEILEVGVGSKLNHAPLFADMPVLARLTSDEHGRARATLAVPERYRGDSDARIWARIETPGRKRLLRLRSLWEPAGAEPTRMFTFAGGTLVGTVVDEHGLPVEGAEPGLILERDGVSERVIAGLTVSDHLGRFAIDYHHAGTYDLQARIAGMGSGLVRSLELPLGAAPGEVQLIIRPGVTLGGRVVDPVGHPVPGLEVTALPRAGFPTAAQRIEREAAGGLLLGITRTDRLGRFELANMVAGEYALHGTYAPRNSSALKIMEERLGPLLGALSAPSGELGEVVSSACRLEVTVTDHAGLPIHLLGASSAETSAPNRPGRIRATAVGEWAPELRAIEFEDLLVFPAEPGREYLVSWQQPGVSYFETRALVPPGLHRVPVRIRLSRPGVPAQLEVQVRVPPAVAAPSEGYWNDLEVVVRSEDGGRMLARTVLVGAAAETNSAETSWTTSLPPGRYTVEVDTAVMMGCTSPSPYPRDPYLATSREVELMAGDERTIELQVGAAGHLDFEPLEPRRAMREAERRDLTPDNLVSPEVIDSARQRLSGVRVIFLSPSGAERFELQRFEVPGLGLSLDGVGWIVRGWTARGLSAAPVGDWTLRLVRGREVVLERPVTITQGAVTTVRW